MPPPPPNFLPAGRRRRRLDPTRHLKSRELWNKVRFHASASTHGDDGSSSTSNLQWAAALLRAVAYELQPFRMRPALARARIFVCEEEGLQHLSMACFERAKSAASTMQKLGEFVYQQLKQMDLDTVKSSFVSNKSFLAKVSIGIFALKIYYRVLLYLHDLLHAGPIIIILTLLTLLYTIGLGDNTGAASGVPSAYSVFNRGMRRIMGTVDGEELARQYAGGAMAAGGMNNNNDVIEFDEGGVWVNDDDEGADDDEEERNLVNERRRQRRLERLQQRRNEEGGDGATDDDVPPQENDDTPQLNEEAQSDEEDEAAPDLQLANESRKSGKKARRRNLELRREMQRQRQAAAAMGFGAGVEADHAREMEARMALG